MKNKKIIVNKDNKNSHIDEQIPTDLLNINKDNLCTTISNTSYFRHQISSKMFISFSEINKLVYLWDEKTCSTINCYDDSSQKSSYNMIKVVNRNLYSDYFYAINQNKSIITLYSTSITDPIAKFSPLDEGVSCADISDHTNNNILILGSTKGNISLYDISSGNCFANFNVSCNSIIKIVYDSYYNLIIVLDRECVKTYTLNSIMSSDKYISNYNMSASNTSVSNDDLYVNENIVITNSSNYKDAVTINTNKELFLLIFNDQKIDIYNLIKYNNNNDNYLYSKVLFDESENITYICTSSNDICSFYISTYNKVYYANIYKIKLNEKEIINKEMLELVIKTENQITCIECGANSIAVGLDNNEIHLFSIIDYKFVNKFCNMKGPAKSILSISRPISQYGINYNKNLKTKETKKLEKIYNSKNSQLISLELSYKNYYNDTLDNLIDECNDLIVNNYVI